VTLATGLGEKLAGSRFLRFALIGTAGFLVNEGTLWLALNVLGANKYVAGLLAFIVAVTFTWWGNRKLTFHERAVHGPWAALFEWGRFVIANSLGFAVNYSIYVSLVTFAPSPENSPYLALACGAIAGLFFNFVMSNRVVFRARP
jgi:putative flippase GtrA